MNTALHKLLSELVAGPETHYSARRLLVVDNAISHSDEIAPFIELVEADSDFTTSLVPVGKGEYLATKSIPIGRGIYG